MVALLQRAEAAPGRARSIGGRWTGLIVALVLLVLAVALSLAIGARAVSLPDVVGALFAPVAGDNDQMVVRDLRVPRTLLGLFAGAALALAGTLMQGLTRNPLADPGLLGVNAGASLFVVLAITWFGVSRPSGYVWFALLGAAVAALVVYGIGASRAAGATPLTLALAGTAVTAAVTSLITLVLISDLQTLGQYRFWSVGSLVGRDLNALTAVLPLLAAGAVLAAVLGRPLNALALGEDVARGLGQRVGVTRALAAVAIVLLCGGATAIAGPIVFVGLVVPHIARRFTGPDYRWIAAYSVVLGPALLILADVVGRVVAPPGELEAGIVVALIGVPVLVWLVRRSRSASL